MPHRYLYSLSLLELALKFNLDPEDYAFLTTRPSCAAKCL